MNFMTQRAQVALNPHAWTMSSHINQDSESALSAFPVEALTPHLRGTAIASCACK
ncbi:hypothetical protein PQR11_15690 [Paraburkholderia strydomiana]|jgi:hypothetical protein|uniref:hypothetical protein n=1 Tax=Paraburkholderia strydomiana TaxID=1245417 RepID=UPI0038BABDE1